MIGIYAITNNVNGKQYIGQSVDIENRWKEHIWHLNENNHHNKHLQSSWNKYGENNFSFNIIEECEDCKLSEREIYYISKYDTFNSGYNLTIGGEGTTGHRLSDDVKKIIGDAQRGKEISKKHRDALSKNFSGSGNPFYNKRHSDKTKELMSNLRIEKCISKGGNNPKAKPVICNGVTYECATDCANYYEIKSCTLRSWLRGNRPMPEEFKSMGLKFV